MKTRYLISEKLVSNLQPDLLNYCNLHCLYVVFVGDYWART
jgi:uncharacterized protein YutD